MIDKLIKDFNEIINDSKSAHLDPDCSPKMRLFWYGQEIALKYAIEQLEKEQLANDKLTLV